LTELKKSSSSVDPSVACHSRVPRHGNWGVGQLEAAFGRIRVLH
jgi:hypothetical protein